VLRPSVILKSVAGAPPREVPLSEARLAAMLETNRSAFVDEAALLRHLRRGRSVSMVLSEYRLHPEQTLRLA
jgi:hypothetical protein